MTYQKHYHPEIAEQVKSYVTLNREMIVWFCGNEQNKIFRILSVLDYYRR